MVQSIDRLVARVRREVGPNTFVVLTADNGFHLGQHQLNGGKGTPYDSDTRVPLVVVGPGVPVRTVVRTEPGAAGGNGQPLRPLRAHLRPHPAR
jgi:arylsulfatase A-like enzyme